MMTKVYSAVALTAMALAGVNAQCTVSNAAEAVLAQFAQLAADVASTDMYVNFLNANNETDVIPVALGIQAVEGDLANATTAVTALGVANECDSAAISSYIAQNGGGIVQLIQDTVAVAALITGFGLDVVVDADFQILEPATYALQAELYSNLACDTQAPIVSLFNAIASAYGSANSAFSFTPSGLPTAAPATCTLTSSSAVSSSSSVSSSVAVSSSSSVGSSVGSSASASATASSGAASSTSSGSASTGSASSSAPAVTSTATATVSGNSSYTTITTIEVGTSTEVVTEYTTYCPFKTTFTEGSSTYIVTEATTVTVTNCPCTRLHTETTTITTVVPCESTSSTVAATVAATESSSVAVAAVSTVASTGASNATVSSAAPSTPSQSTAVAPVNGASVKRVGAGLLAGVIAIAILM
jgi:hypothetical protein